VRKLLKVFRGGGKRIGREKLGGVARKRKTNGGVDVTRKKVGEKEKNGVRNEQSDRSTEEEKEVKKCKRILE